MKRENKEKLIDRLNSELRNMRHNAKSRYWRYNNGEAFWDWFNMQAEFEIDYMHDGLGMTAREYKRELKKYRPQERYYWLVSRASSEYGRLYTWGRSGGTLAPEKLVSGRGGSSYSIAQYDADDISASDASELLAIVAAFNSYVRDWCSAENIGAMWREYASEKALDYMAEAIDARNNFAAIKRELRAIKLPDAICNAMREKMRGLWRVWCNPPYGTATFDWMRRCATHGNAIALIFARTETKGFHAEIWDKADAVFFFKGRLAFHHVDGTRGNTANAPSCLVAYGTNNIDAIRASGLNGRLILL